jgi:hypothetical protein
MGIRVALEAANLNCFLKYWTIRKFGRMLKPGLLAAVTVAAYMIDRRKEVYILCLNFNDFFKILTISNQIQTFV